MSLSPISSRFVASAYGASQPATEHAGQAPTAGRSVADHVAAADDSEPIRSGSTTLGTMVDTYL